MLNYTENWKKGGMLFFVLLLIIQSKINQMKRFHMMMMS